MVVVEERLPASPSDVVQLISRRREPTFLIVDRHVRPVLVPNSPEREVPFVLTEPMQSNARRLIGTLESSEMASAVTILPVDTILRVMPLCGVGEGPLFAVFVETYHARDAIAGAAKRFALSAREVDIVRALLRGDGYATIADELSIAECTVQAHIGHIARKTGSHNRKEIVATILGLRQIS